jgi:hypothetical protein
MTLQPFVGPWPLFQVLDLLHNRYDSLDGDQPVAVNIYMLLNCTTVASLSYNLRLGMKKLKEKCRLVLCEDSQFYFRDS